MKTSQVNEKDVTVKKKGRKGKTGNTTQLGEHLANLNTSNFN